MFDLKDFRVNVLKMTQAQFATLIDERQDAVSRMEKNPESISLVLLHKIANAVGMTIDQLVGFEKNKLDPLYVDDTWNNLRFVKKTITDYIVKKLRDNENNNENKYNNITKELNNMVKRSIQKPKVAIVGMSDAGKSKLINALLGSEKMPTSWTPTTSISVHIKHVEDRPSFIEDEAWVLKSGQDDEKGWDVAKIDEEEYCKQWKLASGSIDILSKYGVRHDEESEADEAGAAVIFIDSPILKVCDLVDLPGFGTGDRKTDDVLSQKAKNYADVVIYMSISNGFLRATDIEFLKSTLNYLPVLENDNNNIEPLGNLFVLASQAHVVDRGDKNQLTKILDAGCSRLYKQIPAETWENKNQISELVYDESTLRKRFFTYTTDIESLRVDFEKTVKQFIEKLPEVLLRRVKITIEEFINKNRLEIDKDINNYYDIINKREEYVKILKQTKENEPNRKKEANKLKKDVINKIKSLNVDSKIDFEKEYTHILSIDNIINIIDKKDYKKKKEDMELLAGFISSKLQARLQKVLKCKSENLNNIIEKYIKDFNVIINKPIDIELRGVNIPFNAKRAFASGLAGVATYGALAVWASTLGNLGAYILVAKGVSALSAIGISIAGGTAGASAAIASLGGPVVLGIALAVITATAMFSLLSGGWKKSVAKKMIKEYNKEDTIEKFNEVIIKFWSDTEKAFISASNTLEKKYQDYIRELEKIVTNYNIEEIENCIKQAKEMKDFLDNVPL